MENKTVKGAANRRAFLVKAGKQALWMAPTLTVLLAASSQPAKATGRYGHTYTPKTYSILNFLKKLKKR